MSFKRKAFAASFIAPLALSASVFASAASGNHSPLGPKAEAEHVTRLPKGVHFRPSGVYTESVCPNNGKAHCLLERVLPNSYDPAREPLPSERAMFVPRPVTQAAPAGMGPPQVTAAYGLNAAGLPTGQGAIVAIIDSPDPYALQDVNMYRSIYGLPALTACTGNGLPVAGGPTCFASVDQNGALLTATEIGTQDASSAPGDGETALDMEMIAAACPACSVLLVQYTGNDSTGAPDDGGMHGWDDIHTAVKTAQRLGAVATSISLGQAEADDAVWADFGMSAPGSDPTGWSVDGSVVFVAAGDYGYDNESFIAANVAEDAGGIVFTTPSFPSSAPDVVAVGGTILLNTGATYSETVWSYGVMSQDGTTSGCSIESAQPSWQGSVTGLPSACAKRATADISAAASFTTVAGATNFLPDGGENILPDGSPNFADMPSDIVMISVNPVVCGQAVPAGEYCGGGVEGTSAASPLVAALFARLGATAALSANLGWPYAHATAFNDITSGTDDLDKGVPQCTQPILCTAAAGWDGPTGIGTPKAAAIFSAIGGKLSAADAGGDANVSVGDGAVPSGDAMSTDGSHPSGDSGQPSGDASQQSTGDGSTTPVNSSKSGCSMVGGTGSTSAAASSAFLLGLVAMASRRRRSRR